MWAEAKCGKPSVAPRTPAEGNKWRHLAPDLGEVLSSWERITGAGHRPDFQSDEHRFKEVCNAWLRRACVRCPPNTKWAKWNESLLDVLVGTPSQASLTVLRDLAKTQAGKMVGRETLGRRKAFRDLLR